LRIQSVWLGFLQFPVVPVVSSNQHIPSHTDEMTRFLNPVRNAIKQIASTVPIDTYQYAGALDPKERIQENISRPNLRF